MPDDQLASILSWLATRQPEVAEAADGGRAEAMKLINKIHLMSGCTLRYMYRVSLKRTVLVILKDQLVGRSSLHLLRAAQERYGRGRSSAHPFEHCEPIKHDLPDYMLTELLRVAPFTERYMGSRYELCDESFSNNSVSSGKRTLNSILYSVAYYLLLVRS